MIMVKPEPLISDKLEFPRINYAMLGQKYHFFYALGNDFLHPNRVILIFYLKFEVKGHES